MGVDQKSAAGSNNNNNVGSIDEKNMFYVFY